jgi:general secretion pathway protein G
MRSGDAWCAPRTEPRPEGTVKKSPQLPDRARQEAYPTRQINDLRPRGVRLLTCPGDSFTVPEGSGNARWRRRRLGFTLIELMIVMMIITIIVSISIPMYQKAIVRAKESVLKNNLFTLRTLIDEYTFDKTKAPQSLEDLVREGYLRQVPVDPITGSNQTWQIIMEDAMASVNQMEPGIFDVRSGSDQTSLEGTPYSEW